jgi:hypothetical protein
MVLKREQPQQPQIIPDFDLQRDKQFMESTIHHHANFIPE